MRRFAGAMGLATPLIHLLYGLKEDELPVFRLIAFTSTVLCCSACVPCPHMEAVSPAIWGLVTEGGEPVSDYVLFRTAGLVEDPCGDERYGEVTTDEQGEFEFPIKKRFLAVAIVMDKSYRVALCAAADSTLLWTEDYMGSVPHNQCVVCDLSAGDRADSICELLPVHECLNRVM